MKNKKTFSSNKRGEILEEKVCSNENTKVFEIFKTPKHFCSLAKLFFHARQTFAINFLQLFAFVKKVYSIDLLRFLSFDTKVERSMISC